MTAFRVSTSTEKRSPTRTSGASVRPSWTLHPGAPLHSALFHGVRTGNWWAPRSGPKRGKNPMHVDFASPDPATGQQRIEALGGRRHEVRPGESNPAGDTATPCRPQQGVNPEPSAYAVRGGATSSISKPSRDSR
ncbi:VOC family protein [Streptomyces sp. NPDC051657]|uniref:VOC family protein n=1 Tax=unclassified Streptomyces TaxID=2593676 RepID=UPI00341D12CA